MDNFFHIIIIEVFRLANMVLNEIHFFYDKNNKNFRNMALFVVCELISRTIRGKLF